jgi:hypothetical protein
VNERLMKAIERGEKAELEAAVIEAAAGRSVYMLATCWPTTGGEMEGAEEDGPDDLIKIGESIRPVDRVPSHFRASPLPLRLTAVLTPFRDGWVHHLLEGEGQSCWERALELGLPTPNEWFRGGCEEGFITRLLMAKDMDWVRVRLRGNDGTWSDAPRLWRRT